MFTIAGSSATLVMHWNPDVDAIAACFTVVEALRQKYPKLPIYVVLKVRFKSFYFKEFEEVAEVITEEELPEDTTVYLLDHHDNGYSLLEDWHNPKIKEFIIIDHHQDIEKILVGKLEGYEEPQPIKVPIKQFVDTNKISTTQVLFEALKGMNTISITPDIANYLYTGIYSDCMRFSIPISLEIHKTIVELAEQYGADLDCAGKFNNSRSIYWHRNFSPWWQQYVSMASLNSRVALVKVPLEAYKKLTIGGDKPYSFIFDVLNCRRVNHVLMILQTGPKRWLIKAISRHKGATTECIGHYFKDKIYSKTIMNYKKVLELESAVIKKLDNWDLDNGFRVL